MPTFKATIRKQQLRRDGKYPVSIRVTHNRVSAYIPTGLYVSQKQVSKHYEIKDQFVLQRTNQTIRQYEEKLLEIDTEELREMPVRSIADRMTRSNGSADYSAYCKNLISQNAKKWAALKQALLLAKEIGYAHLDLRDVDRRFVDRFRQYIDDREIPATGNRGARKLASKTKNDYMMRLHQAYKMMVLELGEEAYKYTKLDPFLGVKLFKPDAPKKGSIPVEDLRKFFAYKTTLPKERLAQDITKMSFCLGGMNLGDLILVTKDCLHGNVLKYQRHKTKGNRADGAWTAITIQPEIADLVEKYKAKKGDRLFDFGLDWDDTTSRNYGMAVDRLCKHAGLPHYNPYLFRHTVASIARNKFRYSRDDVGMLLNHRGPMTIDDVYIDDDFSINDEMNRKILDYVFNSKS